MKEKTIYALGFFDGVHLGHQALLQDCKALADREGCKAGVVTFIGHPDTLVSGVTPRLINTPEDRKKLLLQFHMDAVVELPFDQSLMQMPWRSFLEMLQENYGAVGFVCGADFRFGDRGQGTAAVLQQYCWDSGLPCQVVPEQRLDGTVISSTHIRALLEQGQMEAAVRFLGHPHILTATVVSGRQLGRTIGIPTANLEVPEGIVGLRHGVYACKAEVLGKTLLAVTNVGIRPTVGGDSVTVEPWLLDFEGDLYGQKMTLQFFAFLREEKKFSSLEELKAEIQKNALQTKELLEKS